MAISDTAINQNSAKLAELSTTFGVTAKVIDEAVDKIKAESAKIDGKEILKSSGLQDLKGNLEDVLIKKALTPGEGLSKGELDFLVKLDDIIDKLKGVAKNEITAVEGALNAGELESGQIETQLGFLKSQLDGQVKLISDVINKDINAAIKSFKGSVTGAFKDLALKGEFSVKKIGNAFVESAFDLISKKFLSPGVDSLFGSIFGSIFGRAGGGTVSAGVPVLVGERSAELFVPEVPGRILNGADTRRAFSGGIGGGNVTIQQTNTFTTDVQNSVRAEVLNAAPLIADAAAAKVVNMLSGRRF